MTGGNCSATAPLLLPCSIAYCITDTCCSADRAAGVPKPLAARKDNDKNKSDKDAGQRTPGGVANPDPGLRRRSLTIGILVKNTNPSAVSPASETAEGFDRRFLRSQPRVLGPESLRKARPRRSDYYRNTQSRLLNINASLGALRTYIVTR